MNINSRLMHAIYVYCTTPFKNSNILLLIIPVKINTGKYEVVAENLSAQARSPALPLDLMSG